MSTLSPHRQKQINDSIKACHPIRKVKGEARQVLPCQVDADQKTKEQKKQNLSMHKKGMGIEAILPYLCKVDGMGFDLTVVEVLRIHKIGKLIAQTIKENK